MNDYEEAMREIRALRERVEALGAAVLRVNASLDLDTVLREVVEAARVLTGAGVGMVATTDETGGVFGDAYFSGYSPEEQRELEAWPDAARLFAHLVEQPGPLRFADFPAYVRSLGMEPPPTFRTTLQGAPLRHRGVNAGHFLLAGKAGGEPFTDADEEVLVLFAAQAATAIANARAHRAERRARAHLEALVETSPVGVAVVDAASGRTVSLNREARRIMRLLGTTSGDPQEFIESVSFRRADGRAVSLGDMTVAERFGSGETVRAEEIELSTPDGRSVRALVNRSPVHAEDGTVATAVITIQDLAPLEEVERMRTEFLALVGHELRQPLSSIKGSADTMLEEHLDPAEVREFTRIIAEQAGQMRRLVGDLLDAGRVEAGTLSVTPEPADVGELLERARTAFAAGGGRHEVLVDLPVGLPAVLADRRRVAQVIDNLLTNAARHAPESTPIRLAAAREDAHVAVAVVDEGRGIAAETLQQVFAKHAPGRPGGGHGLGLAICKGLVEAHGGRIRADSPGPGRGSTFTFTLPAAGDAASAAARPASDRSAAEAAGARVLVVDDDPRMLRFVRDALSAAGYAPVVTGAPEELSDILRTERPRLVLLDLVLPGVDGIELMERVPELADVPVIFISGYGRDETVARALDAGAEDYLVKPFSPTELVARVRTALRRHDEPEPFTLGALAIDYGRRRVTVAGEAVELTATEYELLRQLSLAAGRPVSHETLLRRLWPDRKDAEPNLVRNFMRNLRRRLGDDAANPTWIFNERGVGYRMPEPPAR